MQQAIVQNNYKALIKILGAIILITGVAMAIPLIYALATGDKLAIKSFIYPTPIAIIVGAALMMLFRDTHSKFRTRDGYLVVTLCWIIASFIGAFPYYINGIGDNFLDAFFESTSGFTTTGCTAVADGVLSKSLLLWKALSHWLGGMGILIFVLSILPAIGINGQFIAKAEAPGPTFEKIAVRLSDSTKLLYITYLILTIIESILLALSSKMGVFDAIVNSMGSISTGGLLVHPDGVSYHDSIYVEVVISAFCLLSSINFIMYHYLRQGNLRKIAEDIELRTFRAIIAIGIFICTIMLMYNNDFKLPVAFRDSFFQVISMATTTGYVRSPYVLWPTTCQMVLLTLMFIGGCSASTSGSLKVIRFIAMIKFILRGTQKRVHPRQIVPVKIGDTIISPQVATGITSFILAYMAIFLFSCIVVGTQGFDMETTIGSVLAMLSNTGVAFGVNSSAGNFSAFNSFIKLYFCLLMYIGRLEIFTVLVMFTKGFWNGSR